MDTTSLSCERLDGHSTCQPDSTHLENTLLINPLSLLFIQTELLKALHDLRSSLLYSLPLKLTSPQVQDFTIHFETKFRPTTKTKDIKNCVRVIRGLWENYKPRPVLFNFGFLKKIYLSYLVDLEMSSLYLATEKSETQLAVVFKKIVRDLSNLSLPEAEVRRNY